MMGLAVRLFAPKHRVGVGVVVLDEVGQVLLLKHVFHPDFPWGLPGGWLDRDEAPDAAARRELWEETGLQGTIEAILMIERERYPSHLGIAYLATVEPGQVVVSGEILEACWFDVADLPPLLPFTERAIATAVAHAQHTLHLEVLS
jgi:ADP-ribose pyrophosphatase YjhB (NUDIX family)